MEWQAEPCRLRFECWPLLRTALHQGPPHWCQTLWVLYLCFLSLIMESATATFPWLAGYTGVQNLPEAMLLSLRKHWILPQWVRLSGGGGAHFLPRAEQPTEDLLPPLGNWTSPLNPPLPFFLFFLFGGLASNYLILFTLHPSFMVQKTCRCKYVPPSLTSPPFLIYVISIFLPCTVN